MLAGAVAEMTGRRGRVVGDTKGRGVFELRAKPDSTEMDSLNVSETGTLPCAAAYEHEHLYCLSSGAFATLPWMSSCQCLQSKQHCY